MAPGDSYHCLISSPFDSENISYISPSKSDVLQRVMKSVLHGYFSKRIRPICLEDPSDHRLMNWNSLPFTDPLDFTKDGYMARPAANASNT